jgi:hypothetical protein
VIINGIVEIKNFLSGFTLRNLTVINSTDSDSAAIWARNNRGTIKLTDVIAQATEEDSSGIIIDGGGAELTRVISSDNAYHGLWIPWKTPYSSNWSPGPVKITDCTFDGNLKNVNDGISDYENFTKDTSVEVWVQGAITINGMSSSGNNGTGAVFHGRSSINIKNSIFNDNALGIGFRAHGKSVTLENIEANRNKKDGIQSGGGDGFTFSATHVTSDNNGNMGIRILNASCSFPYSGSDCVPGPIGAGATTFNLTGASGNGENGLNIITDGAFSFTEGYMGDNGGNGIYLDNSFSNTLPAVTITKVETPRNHENGIDLKVKGPVTLKEVLTYDNSLDGLRVVSSGTGVITITHASNLFNETRNNGGNGFSIETLGPVTITNLYTHDNGLLGGYIDNSGAASAAAVTINMLGTPAYVNGYWGNGAGGLQVFSRGAVTISRVQINNNGGFGAEINNVPAGLIAGTPVTISDSSFDSNGFGDDGLNITSKGQITLLNIRANYNGGYGVYLNNQITGATAGVTINAGTGRGNEFQGNRLSGLVVRTNGPAVLTNLYSANNGYNTYETISDFSMYTYVALEPDMNFQFSGLVIYGNNNNFVQLGRAYCGVDGICVGNGIYFDAIFDGSFSGSNYGASIVSPSAVFLRLDRTGDNLDGFYSEDGSNWIYMGSHTLPAGFQISGVGLTASQDSSKSVPDKASDFDFFMLSDPNVTEDFYGSMGAGWVWVNENPNYWNLSDTLGYLRIYNSTGSTGDQNMLVKTVGSGYGVLVDAKGAVTLKQVGGWGVQNNWVEGNVFNNNADGGLKILSSGAVNVAFFQASYNSGSGIDIDAHGGSGAVTVSGMSNSWQNLSNNNGDGLSIVAKGLITATNLSTNSNIGYGVYLDNQIPGATGGVTINAVSGMGNEFQWNTLDGLRILTNGPVTLTNIYASNNLYWDEVDPATGGYGVYIDNSPGTAAVTIKQVGSWCGNNYCTEGNSFNGNRDGGLRINTKGAVTVSFFQARDNWDTGILVDADGGVGAVAISGMPNWGDNLANNGGDGIDVAAKGNITLSKLQASGNNGYGGLLDNCAYDFLLDKCLGSGSVTLTDTYFDRNANDGLDVKSAGVLSWKNGSASNNGGFGAYLDNYAGIGKAVTVSNVNNASWNFKTGLRIISRGVVTITDTQADTNSMNKHAIADGEWWKDNLSDGQVWFYEGTKDVKATILVDSSRFMYRITVKDSNGDDVSLSSDVAGEWYFTPVDNLIYEILVEEVDNWNGNGYEIRLYEGDTPPDWGTITPSDDPANGIFVDNSKGTNTGVTISNASNRWNSNNSGTDVEVYSSGLITLKGMELNDSGAGGLIAINSGATVGTPGVTLTNVNFYVDDGGVESILEGGSPVDELVTAYIATKGPVTVKTSNLNSNFGYGYYVDNYSFGSALSPITFTDVSVDGGWGQSLGFENPGITLLSRGAVTLTNVSSDNNFGDGINIHTQGAVIFKGAWANNNWGEVGSGKGYGAYVVTSMGTFTLNAPSSGINGFSENDLDGLYVEAGGRIILTRIFANGNGWQDEYGVIQTEGNGITLDSTNDLGTAPITLTEVTTNGNTQYGLDLYTKSAVTVSNLQSNDNIEYGVFIDQSDATDSLKPIILNKITASNNGMDGIHVDSMGSIMTNGIRAYSNEHSGMVLDNAYTNSAGTITILNSLGRNMIYVNGQSCTSGGCTPNTDAAGVKLLSNGAVTVVQLESGYNYGQGLWVDNSGSAAQIKPAVTLNSILTRGNFYNGSGVEVDNRENWGHGMVVKSSGVITINNSWSVSNQGDGLRITSNANVFINNSTFIGNNNAGIWTADSTGTPTLKLTGTTWFGNLRHFSPIPGLDVPTGDRNLWLGTGWAPPLIF